MLWIDEGKSDKEIAKLHNVSLATVGNTRKKWVLESTVEDKPRPGRLPILDGKQEAMLVSLACSDAPDGVGKVETTERKMYLSDSSPFKKFQMSAGKGLRGRA